MPQQRQQLPQQQAPQGGRNGRRRGSRRRGSRRRGSRRRRIPTPPTPGWPAGPRRVPAPQRPPARPFPRSTPAPCPQVRIRLRPVYSVYKELLHLKGRAEGSDDAPAGGAASSLGSLGGLAAARRGRPKQQNLLYYLKEVDSYAALQVRCVVWCVAWRGVVWCGVVWCGVVWCGVVWCGVVWRGVVCVWCAGWPAAWAGLLPGPRARACQAAAGLLAAGPPAAGRSRGRCRRAAPGSLPPSPPCRWWPPSGRARRAAAARWRATSCATTCWAWCTASGRPSRAACRTSSARPSRTATRACTPRWCRCPSSSSSAAWCPSRCS
jgi:hypothetical protein